MTIQEKANKLQYIKNNLEITLNLTEAIQAIYQDDYLKQSLILKGGAAIQLYLENFKRLFFDLDIDFTQDIVERETFRNHLIECMTKLGYDEISSKKSRFSYSLDSYRFPYFHENGNLDYLKLDINYSYGSHLYPTEKKTVTNENFNLEQTVSLVNLEELIALKMAALQERGRIKDLFDIYQVLIDKPSINLEKVKSAYLFYMVLADCRDKIEKTDKITGITNYDAKVKLYPLIPKQSNPNLELMKKEVLDFVKECSIQTTEQKEFIEDFSKGYNNPEYLFDDKLVIENALNNPIAKWKTKLKQK